MANQISLDLHPEGLSRSQLSELSKLVSAAAGKSISVLLKNAHAHLARAKEAGARNPLVNVPLATAICDTIRRVAGQWDGIVPHARHWLAASFMYFSEYNGDEPDFSSPIGFEDDTEILNACLRFAKLGDLCLKVEDYDDV